MLCRGAVQGTMAKFDTCDDWIIQGMIMIIYDNELIVIVQDDARYYPRDCARHWVR